MRRLIWVLVVLMCLPSPGVAQTGKDSWENLKQLQVGQKIQVVDQKLKSLKGTFLGVSEAAISLRTETNDVTVEAPQVLRVSRLNASKRKRNIILGIAIGAGAGMGGGAALAFGLYDEGDAAKATALGLGLTAAGAALGAAAGAASGYQTLYRASKKQGARPDFGKSR